VGFFTYAVRWGWKGGGYGAFDRVGFSGSLVVLNKWLCIDCSVGLFFGACFAVVFVIPNKEGLMVAGISYDEKALSVVQSLRPYLGVQGNGCLVALESLLELLNSEPAQKTLDALQILGPGEGFKELTMRDESPKESKPMKLFFDAGSVVSGGCSSIRK
jgi:hypothetical protein